MTTKRDLIAVQMFDYVIIGGGTAGLTVAARLAEDSNISVAVLEAGPENINDPLIKTPGQFGKHFGDPKYDWCMQTVPQKHCNDRTFPWTRGKTLGGSSAINYYGWTKPPAHDIDAWEKLGNPGWNWKNYQEFSKKTESFTPPKDADAKAFNQAFNPDAHGYSGPLKTSFPEFVTTAELPFQQTLLNAGVRLAADPQNGDPIGTFMAVSSLDPSTLTRSYSATAFYVPNKEKQNFHVLCDAMVLRTVTKGSGAGVRATAVEFEHKGVVNKVSIKREVLVCAGTLKSPQILELSGVGNNNILKALGISTIVDLPGVGENMQEHMCFSVAFELDSNLSLETLDVFALADKDYVAEQFALHAERKGVFRFGVSGTTLLPLSLVTFTKEIAHEMAEHQRSRIEQKSRAGLLASGLREQYEIRLVELENGTGGNCEFIIFPAYFTAGTPEAGKTYVTVVAMLCHPFSRGSIHASSKDPKTQPEIDPHYFEDPFDLDVMYEMMKFVRRLIEVEPYKNMLVKEAFPGADCESEEDMKTFIKSTCGTIYHTVGSLSMLPRAQGGVVDPELKVYGTDNIRVVDLSIVPLQIGAHTQSTVYAIAEQAADIIKKTA